MNLEELKLKLTAVFEPPPKGGYTCHFEELPEVFSEGERLEEAKSNLLDKTAHTAFVLSLRRTQRDRQRGSKVFVFAFL